jgi:protein-tyrosine-phosphatase
MERSGIDMSQARPKHLDEFRGWQFDTIITVCDRVREVCPLFPGDPERIHWSLPDPTMVAGDEETRLQIFEQLALQLATRIRLLIILLERERQK